MNDVQYFDRKNHLETPRTFLGYKMKPKTTYICVYIQDYHPSVFSGLAMVMPTSKTEARHFRANCAVLAFESGLCTVHCTKPNTCWNPCASEIPSNRRMNAAAKHIRYGAREAQHETTTVWLSWTFLIRLLNTHRILTTWFVPLTNRHHDQAFQIVLNSADIPPEPPD